MSEILMLMVMLFAAYLFMPSTLFSKVSPKEKLEMITAKSTKTVPVIPEDSVLRRHFLTQLRSEIERELFTPRPSNSSDSALQRHYDAMVETELEKRLA